MNKTDELKQLGLSDAVAEFISTNDKTFNNEGGLNIGETFTIEGIADEVSSFDGEDGKPRYWVDVLTSGDCDRMSLARLAGTPKLEKYFGANAQNVEWAKEASINDAFDFPKRASELVQTIYDLLNPGGRKRPRTTFQVIAKATDCGNFNSTYYLYKQL